MIEMYKKYVTIEDCSPHDFHYFGGVDVHCEDSYHPCTCGPVGICRCSTIGRVDVTVDVYELAENIATRWFKKHTKAEHMLLHYCISRVLTALHLYDSDNWYVHIRQGYYGEEPGSITPMTVPLQRRIIDLASSPDMLLFALQCEYSFILPELENREWKLQSVPLTNKVGGLVFGSRTQMQKKEYSDTGLYEEELRNGYPAGLALPDNGMFRLIDGYTRCSIAKSMGMKEVLLWVGW